MFITKPKGPRSKINRKGNSLELVIPSRKNYFVLIFLPLWLVGWAFAEFSALRSLLGHSPGAPQPFLIFWLCGWTVGGLFAFTLFAWNAFGHEIVIINSSSINVEKRIGGIKYSKLFAMNEIKNIRVVEMTSSYLLRYQEDFIPNFKHGTIAFDYGMKTYRFAAGIDEAEARHVVGRLQQEGYFKT